MLWPLCLFGVELDPKLNIAPLMTTIENRFPTIFNALKTRGFSADSFEIPVQPLVHYTLGGIVANTHGQTNCDGLFAIGECAVTGFHGANRLASNSLLEAGVMGQRCAHYLSQISAHPVSESSVTEISIASLTPNELGWLGDLVNHSLGVIRSNDIISHGI